jgi:hypothetical protein
MWDSYTVSIAVAIRVILVAVRYRTRCVVSMQRNSKAVNVFAVLLDV